MTQDASFNGTYAAVRNVDLTAAGLRKRPGDDGVEPIDERR
jgi:hypothetical protein